MWLGLRPDATAAVRRALRALVLQTPRAALLLGAFPGKVITAADEANAQRSRVVLKDLPAVKQERGQRGDDLRVAEQITEIALVRAEEEGLRS